MPSLKANCVSLVSLDGVPVQRPALTSKKIADFQVIVTIPWPIQSQIPDPVVLFLQSTLIPFRFREILLWQILLLWKTFLNKCYLFWNWASRLNASEAKMNEWMGFFFPLVKAGFMTIIVFLFLYFTYSDNHKYRKQYKRVFPFNDIFLSSESHCLSLFSIATKISSFEDKNWDWKSLRRDFILL